MAKKISIVIVSYNVRSYLDQCLLSVQKAVEGIDAEVFVVDNASSDYTTSVFPPRYPWVTFIASEENLGFARGNNLTICRATCRYLILLSPVTTLS